MTNPTSGASHEPENLETNLAGNQLPQTELDQAYSAAIQTILQKWKDFDFGNQALDYSVQQELNSWKEMLDTDYVEHFTSYCGHCILMALDDMSRSFGKGPDGELIKPEIQIDYSTPPVVMHFKAAESESIGLVEWFKALTGDPSERAQNAHLELMFRVLAATMSDFVVLCELGLKKEALVENQRELAYFAERITETEQALEGKDPLERESHLKLELLKNYTDEKRAIEQKMDGDLGFEGLEIIVENSQVVFRVNITPDQNLEHDSITQWINQRDEELRRRGAELLACWKEESFEARLPLSQAAVEQRQQWLEGLTDQDVGNLCNHLIIFIERSLSRLAMLGDSKEIVKFTNENQVFEAQFATDVEEKQFSLNEIVEGYFDSLQELGKVDKLSYAELALVHILSSLPKSYENYVHGRPSMAVECPDENTLIVRRRSYEEIRREQDLNTSPACSFIGINDLEQLGVAMKHIASIGGSFGERGATQYTIDEVKVVAYDYLDESYQVVFPEEHKGTVVAEDQLDQYVIARRSMGEWGAQLPIVTPSNRHNDITNLEVGIYFRSSEYTPTEVL